MMLYRALMLFTSTMAFMVPRAVAPPPRARAVAATRLRSMEEDADDNPSDSAVPDEPEPEPTGDEADAPSDGKWFVRTKASMADAGLGPEEVCCGPWARVTVERF